jgi:predicted permease
LIAQEVRTACRRLFRRPVYSLTVVLLLGVGIGSAVAVWSTAVLVFRGDLGLGDVDRLVRLVETKQGPSGEVRRVAMRSPAFQAVRGLPVFESVVAQRNYMVAWRRPAGSEPVTLVAVSDRWAETLGVVAARGRLFSADEERLGRGAAVVVVSDGFWRLRLGADPAAVGRTLHLDGQLLTVIGVLPRAFSYPSGAEVWRSENFDPNDSGSGALNVQAKLRAGVSQGIAQAALEGLLGQLRTDFPEPYRMTGLLARGARLDLIEEADAALRSVSVAVGLLLVLALANLAALTTARALEARGEVAVRRALGATPARQTLALRVEGVLLALAGGAVSLGVARGLAVAVVGLVPDRIRTLVDRVPIDGASIAQGVALAIVAGGLLTFLATRIARIAETGRLRRGNPARAAGGRALLAVVAVQTAMTVILVGASAWATVALREQLRGAAGFEPAGLVVTRVALPADPYGDPGPRRQRLAEIRSVAAALPGVETAGFVNHAPFAGGNRIATLEVEGLDLDPARPPIANLRVADEGFLGALGVPAVCGRLLLESDRIETAPVSVISASLARSLFATAGSNERSANQGCAGVGRRIRLAGASQGQGRWTTVVGVARDVLYEPGAEALRATWYLPLAQTTERSVLFTVLQPRLVLRTRLRPAEVTTALRGIAAKLAPEVVVSDAATFEQLRAARASEVRVAGVLLVLFASAALLLAAVGVHGTVNHVVLTRTRELGLRLALGATPRSIAGLVLARLAHPIAWGACGGLAVGGLLWLRAAALRATWPPLPAAAIAVALSVTVAVAFLAAARGIARARRIEPAVALRAE